MHSESIPVSSHYVKRKKVSVCAHNCLPVCLCCFQFSIHSSVIWGLGVVVILFNGALPRRSHYYLFLAAKTKH